MTLQLKRCSSNSNCLHPDGPLLPATREYFHYSHKEKDGFRSRCIACRRKLEKQAPDYIKEYHKAHREKRIQYARRYYQAHKAEHRLYKRQYYQQHRDATIYRTLEWSRKNRDKKKLQYNRREARRRNFPDHFTIVEWETCLGYWHGCCAICGRPPGLWHTLAMDHWIPLTSKDCPGTIATNIVPLCQGDCGCNNRKNARDPKEWLASTYGKRGGMKKARQVAEYFEWVRQSVRTEGD